MKGPKSDKEIKELIAGFESPIRKAKKVISFMRGKITRLKLSGSANLKAMERVETLEALVHYTSHIKAEINESNDNVARWFMAYGELNKKYKKKCVELSILEKISEIGMDEVRKDLDNYWDEKEKKSQIFKTNQQ